MKNMATPKNMDDFLKERLDRFNDWLNNDQVDYSSKVLPVNESLEEKQWILPTEQVVSIINEAELIALQNCVCRSHYKRCNNPLDVCLLLGDFGRKFIEKGEAREIAKDEALAVIKRANEHGLVHLSLYRPDRLLFALCSCCSCCCHDLQLMLEFDQEHLIVHSDFIAETNMDECIHCGACIDRCVFGARIFKDDELVYDANACYGCGLCVTTCPTGATVMTAKG